MRLRTSQGDQHVRFHHKSLGTIASFNGKATGVARVRPGGTHCRYLGRRYSFARAIRLEPRLHRAELWASYWFATNWPKRYQEAVLAMHRIRQREAQEARHAAHA